MGVTGPRRWYVVVAGLNTGVYFTSIKAKKLVKKVSGNKHKKFKTSRDAIRWLQHEFVYNGNAHWDIPHRRELIRMGDDPFNHVVFKCTCYGEEFCDNGYT